MCFSSFFNTLYLISYGLTFPNCWPFLQQALLTHRSAYAHLLPEMPSFIWQTKALPRVTLMTFASSPNTDLVGFRHFASTIGTGVSKRHATDTVDTIIVLSWQVLRIRYSKSPFPLAYLYNKAWKLIFLDSLAARYNHAEQSIQWNASEDRWGIPQAFPPINLLHI